MNNHGGFYILLLSVHGLLRSRLPELGRDPDTGGQIQYVLDLARALIAHPAVEKVDLVTRRIDSAEVDDDYAQPVEPITPELSIVRIRCGPRRYIRKELLWQHLDTFTDNLVQYLRSVETAGRIDECSQLIERLIPGLSAADEPFAAASAQTIAGHVARHGGDLEAATAHFERAAELMFALGHVRHAASARLNLGVIAKDSADFDVAVERLREARALYEHAGDAVGMAIAAANLGSTALASGDAAAARRWLEDAAAELLRLGNRDAGRLAQVMLARACAELGDPEAAESALQAAGESSSARLQDEVRRVREILSSPRPRPSEHSTEPAAPAVPSAAPHSMTSDPGPSRELFRTFLAVNRQLAHESDLDVAMRRLLDAAVTLSGGRQGYLLVVREDGVQREFQSGETGEAAQAFSRSLAHRAVDLQRTLTGADVLADRELKEMPSIRNLEIRSAICAPFRSAAGTSGAIYVEHAGRADAFGQGDKEALEVLADQAAIAVDRMLREEALAGELNQSRRELAVVRRVGRKKPTVLLGDSAPMKALRAEIQKLAPLQLPVLVLGDTGSGKELVAQRVHELGQRKDQPSWPRTARPCPRDSARERRCSGTSRASFTGAERRHVRGTSWTVARRRHRVPRRGRRHAELRCRPSCCACCRNNRGAAAWAPTRCCTSDRAHRRGHATRTCAPCAAKGELP